MPVYEYECTNCNYRFEKRKSINDHSIEICPRCQGKARRVISKNTNFILKGSGFYRNDYLSQSSSSSSCCGMTNPCSDPKRCCENK